MSILALEFSSKRRSVAVLVPPGTPVEMASTSDAGPGPFAMIDEALRLANIQREDIRTIAVGIGPGSYTGIRMAISMAIGWQTGLPVTLIGIASIDAIAFQILNPHAATGQLQPPLTVAIDAQQRQWYARNYVIEQGRVVAPTPIEIVETDALPNPADGHRALVGPDIASKIARGIDHAPEAATVAKLATSSDWIIQSGTLSPLYLRPTRFVKAPPPRFPNSQA